MKRILLIALAISGLVFGSFSAVNAAKAQERREIQTDCSEIATVLAQELLDDLRKQSGTTKRSNGSARWVGDDLVDNTQTCVKASLTRAPYLREFKRLSRLELDPPSCQFACVPVKYKDGETVLYISEDRSAFGHFFTKTERGYEPRLDKKEFHIWDVAFGIGESYRYETPHSKEQQEWLARNVADHLVISSY